MEVDNRVSDIAVNALTDYFESLLLETQDSDEYIPTIEFGNVRGYRDSYPSQDLYRPG